MTRSGIECLAFFGQFELPVALKWRLNVNSPPAKNIRLSILRRECTEYPRQVCRVTPGVGLPIKEEARVPGNYRFLDYYAKDGISVT